MRKTHEMKKERTEMQTVTLGRGDTMISVIHAEDFAGMCFHKQNLPIGQETDEHRGKTDEDIGAFLRIITTDARSLDVLITACERAKAFLPSAEDDWPAKAGERMDS